jgi:hypothetical protein
MSTLQAIGTPAVHSAAVTNYAPAVPTNFIVTTFSAVRLWNITLSMTFSSDAAYAGGFGRCYLQVLTSVTGLVLGALEKSLASPSQVDSGDLSIDCGGILIGLSDNIEIDFNNGVVYANTWQRAAVTCVYSIP